MYSKPSIFVLGVLGRHEGIPRDIFIMVKGAGGGDDYWRVL